MTRAPEPVPAFAWRLLAVLTALNVLNFVDRTLIASLAPLLIADLGLTRAQVGLLAGFGFVFFYSILGLFLGLAADRFRRIPLVAAGLALWSAMTAITGWARSFAGLAIPRVFVGAGEATLAPSALSMLGDTFPARRLATASGIYYAGIPLGSALALFASSWFAPRYGWRSSFWILGATGVVAALAFAFVREPARRDALTNPVRRPLPALFADLGAALRERREIALTLLGGSMLVYGSASALLVVTWLVEERGFEFSRAAFLAGIMAVVAGFLGNLAGGAFGDLWAKRRPGGHLRSLVPMTLFSVPAALTFYLAEPGGALFFAGWFLSVACNSAYFGPLFAAVQELAPARSRSSVIAFGLLAVNLLGTGPGPLVTGWIGDRKSLSAGLLSSQAVVMLAIVPFALALRRRPAV